MVVVVVKEGHDKSGEGGKERKMDGGDGGGAV